MTWRLAQSLVVLRDQINALYPNRDKRTDGALSGYPGSISGHNPNSQGVVCALDITTGDYPGGISMAQSYALADAIRLELLVAPRGLYTYIIHHMEPPYVPTPGKYIAHGGPASLWQWIPYGGSDGHTSHIHVSVDWDIAAGEDASGQDPYDMSDLWNLSTVSTQSGSIDPIQEGLLMALTDDEQTEVLTKSREMYELLAASKQGALADVFADHLLDRKVIKNGGGEITQRIALSWSDKNYANIPTAILNQTIKLTDGTVATVASVLANIQAKPSAPAVAPTVAVDVKALATELAPLLAVNQVEQFVTEIRNLKFAAQ